MDRSKNLVVWVASFAGVMLLYAAYKGKSPLSLVSAGLSATPATTPATPAPPVGNTTASPTAADSSYSVSNGGVYDNNGNMVGTVPDSYANSPATFIPGNVNVGYQ